MNNDPHLAELEVVTHSGIESRRPGRVGREQRLSGVIKIDNLDALWADLSGDIPNSGGTIGYHTRKRSGLKVSFEDERPDRLTERRHLVQHRAVA